MPPVLAYAMIPALEPVLHRKLAELVMPLGCDASLACRRGVDYASVVLRGERAVDGGHVKGRFGLDQAIRVVRTGSEQDFR